MSKDEKARPVRRLVTFLGIGGYQETIYQFDKKPAQRTRYVCQALAEIFDPQQIVVLATAEAEDEHRAALEAALRGGNCPAPSFMRIPMGRDQDERWEQFRLLKEQLRRCDGPVILDVTHGFRSQPLFAASIVAFVRAVDETPPQLRVCYAAFEARRDNRTPVWEITEFVTLLDWAQALRMFLRTGRAEEAAEETTRLGRELAKRWNQEGRRSERPGLDDLGKALRTFGRDLETLRTGDLLVGRGQASSARRLWKAAQRAKESVETYSPPLADVLAGILELVRPLADERQDLSGAGGREAVAALA